MIQFPETARVEWQVIADAENVEKDLRKRIARDTLVEGELEKLRIRHQAGQEFQHELDAESTPPLEMLTLATYKASPALAPADLIEGVMKDKGLCIMMGPSGSGKSTLALQAAYCLMEGQPFLGQATQKITGTVGVVSYDMDGSLTLDWMAGFPGVDPTRISVVNAHKRGHPLGVPSIRAQIVAAWKASNTEVIVIDSFGASFFGQDGNDQASVMAHYRDLMQFALTEVGARGLMIISHSTTASPHKIRGSTAHHDVADSIVAVVADSKDPNPTTAAREVRMVKYRQHRTGAGVMSHQMSTLMIGAPDNVTHLVDIDQSGMTMAGLSLPPSSAAFTALPDPINPADTDSDSPAESEGEDDL